LVKDMPAASPASPTNRLVDFDNRPQQPRWVAVNDDVMGGRSSGSAVVEGGQLHFSGVMSLENNGGFASVRMRRGFDLSGATAVILRVRGDGRPYQLRLATDVRYRDMPVSFGAEFGTRAGEWTEVRVPLQSLKATVRGSTLHGQQMDPAQVREIGLLIADKREGVFTLTVDWIAVE
jgi:NADH dehydrogenase [ubiquinone] 1 alpha subcomplex assembly factor 1